MLKSCSARSSAKRSAILDAAQRCFLEHGYASTSMDTVAATAAVSKATIYAHFQSKDQLFAAIIHRRCDSLACAADALEVSEITDARATLTTLARQLMSMLLDGDVLCIYRMVVAESSRHADLARTYFEAGPTRGKQRLSKTLDALVSKGLLQIDDTWLAMDQFIGMLRGEHFHRALLGLPAGDRTDLERTIEGAVETIMRAYAPRA
ncbi:TetR/AcrR family transcriptional regulator [Magnetospirillum aberrantis]|uniref:TetR/AcrR family transcriptional regulator n=1 Tax=Magnetospirillum aberrantis SpK TaxID=908842 RepID=A0A7C9QR76_9PROT|nr:TetR/AcrR family transcriptional regulator [Magnetospirillum aberrantis]NFV78643.1 TetR/AcrR family transcriptional regulator [Magnetospirillum aberrantis SpK]